MCIRDRLVAGESFLLDKLLVRFLLLLLLLLLNRGCVRVLHVALVWTEGSPAAVLHLGGGSCRRGSTAPYPTDASLDLVREVGLGLWTASRRLCKHLMRHHLLVSLIRACGHLVIVIVGCSGGASFFKHTTWFLRSV